MAERNIATTVVVCVCTATAGVVAALDEDDILKRL